MLSAQAIWIATHIICTLCLLYNNTVPFVFFSCSRRLSPRSQLHRPAKIPRRRPWSICFLSRRRVQVRCSRSTTDTRSQLPRSTTSRLWIDRSCSPVSRRLQYQPNCRPLCRNCPERRKDKTQNGIIRAAIVFFCRTIGRRYIIWTAYAYKRMYAERFAERAHTGFPLNNELIQILILWTFENTSRFL